MLRPLVPVPVALSLALVLTPVLNACQKPAEKTASASASVALANLQVLTEDIYQVKTSSLAHGPVVTGVIQPERHADLRAEVSSVVLEVLKENGDKVKRGDLLIRLDETAIRDSLRSAQEAVKAAQSTLQQSERQLERQKTLRASGMTSTQALEDAQLRVNSANSEVVAARAREVQARQQLQHTEVRAPFDGLVSERKASVGDTAQVGKELVKVIAPESMRFEGLVAADRIGELQLGQNVSFNINGYGKQEFIGKVRRIDPTANPNTRQVAVQISFEGVNQPKVAGLYAEGRIETGTVSSLTVPEAVLARAGDKAYVWRLSDGKIHKVEVKVGERDSRSGDFAISSGVALGDQLLRNPGINFVDGQGAKIVSSKIVAAADKPAEKSADKSAEKAADKPAVSK
ncbi:MAG: efflux RND transporter periplasmic adaptor subunit [Burkholderiales bacterium]|nr:efflux RND transporter periplasmic adaptor subunit [Burkholderiales bacterium]